MRAALLALATLAATPAAASVGDALSRQILPALADFSAASADLGRAAQEDCRAESLRPAFQAAFDAWMPLSDLHIGPSETGALSIAFWPDDRGFTARTLAGLIAAEDPRHPLSDAEIARLLLPEGAALARRTVAKYRTLAGIAPQSGRRKA